MKRCTKCGLEKDESKFYEDSMTHDGYKSHCKQCHKVEMSRHYQEHREKHLAYVKQYNQEHCEEKRLYYSQHHPQYYQEHWGEIAKYNRQYHHDHPEVHQVADVKRRAQVQESEGTFTTKKWLQMCEETGYRCVYCFQESLNLTMDHVVPLSKGGVHDVSNIVPACKSCNTRKGTKDLIIFLCTQYR
jgi:5-methylcytosine-specific restriction endonuclease McrA